MALYDLDRWLRIFAGSLRRSMWGIFVKMSLIAGLSTFAAAVVLAPTVGSAVAYADPPFYGQTWAKASDGAKKAGWVPAIATVVGSQLPTDDCVVTNAYKSITLDSRGNNAHGGRWLFDLNCNLVVAAPGKPGNSAASPAGAQAKKVMGFIEYWNAGHPDSCNTATAAQWCLQMCDKYGGCSDETEQYFSSHS